jgi:hypothetical protein
MPQIAAQRFFDLGVGGFGVLSSSALEVMIMPDGKPHFPVVDKGPLIS